MLFRSTALWTQLVLLDSAVDSESTHISKSKVAVLLDCLLLDYPLGYRLRPCFLRCSAVLHLQLDYARLTLCQDVSLQLSFAFWTLVALLQIWFTKSAAQLPQWSRQNVDAQNSPSAMCHLVVGWGWA